MSGGNGLTMGGCKLAYHERMPKSWPANQAFGIRNALRYTGGGGMMTYQSETAGGELQTLRPTVEQEIRALIAEQGRITFARFMAACLYSPVGGFYATRGERINEHFGTSATSHPVFGVLLARQLEQMWRLLGAPPVFHVIEVGAGDGALAGAITDSARGMNPGFAQALRYVAADLQPGRPPARNDAFDWVSGMATPAPAASDRQALPPGVQRVRSDGLRAFRNVVGCILCNELIDNFPVHRFAIAGGEVKEIYVTLDGGNLTEELGEPSTPSIAQRLSGLGRRLPEGYRGEVNLAIEDWYRQLGRVLDRGFALTIDYGERATELYAPCNAGGTLVCYRRHAVSSDPYQSLGQQDITCQVDFTALRRAGDRQGLTAVGYAAQRRFLANLGFDAFLAALPSQGLSAARTELNRMAMTALVDPEEYGDFKVLAQARGVGPGVELRGFAGA